MPKSYDKKVILQKIESTEGTDAGPAVATDAILTRNYAPNALEMDTRTRPLDLPFFGSRPQVPVAIRRGATFEVDMAGSGTAATAAPWMAVNRIAGFDAGAPTPTPTPTSVVQKPISTGIPSATHWAYIDNAILKTIGARASMGIRMEDDEFPFFLYTLLGRAPTALLEEATPGAPTLTAWKDPIVVSSENTTFSLDGYAAFLRRLEIDMNVDNQYRSLVGPTDKVAFRNRAPAGTILIELPDLTAKDYFAKVRPGTTMAMSVVHGTVAGNIVEIAAPKVQITGLDIPEEQGVAMLSLSVILQPNAGNDEIVLTSR